MRISLINKERIRNLSLPNKYYGIYWVMEPNSNGEETALISIEAINDRWVLKSNDDVVITENGIELQNKILENYRFYTIKNKKNGNLEILYCSPIYDDTFEKFYINKKNITLGSDASCDLYVKSVNIDKIHLMLEYDNSIFTVKDNNSKNGIYVNNLRINHEKILSHGDSIFVMGIRLIVMLESNKPVIMINNPHNVVGINAMNLTKILSKNADYKISDVCDDEAKLYKEEDYFHKRPRFKESISPLVVSIDPPPAKKSPSDMPVILTVGPMLTSSAITVIYAYITVSSIVKNGANWSTAWPSLTICALSLMATLVWPFIINKYTKHKNKKIEKRRVKAYGTYIKQITKNIIENAAIQKKILIANSPSITELKNAVDTKNVNLWNRKIVDDDFLTVSLGMGDMPMQIDLKTPEVHFMLEKDQLIDDLLVMKDQLPILTNVPLVYNFFDKKVTASIGEYSINKDFIDRIIFQLCVLYSYDDLKIVVLTNETNDKEKKWDYIKVLPHAWDNERNIRFYGTNKDEIREICYYLDNELSKRINEKENKRSSKIPFYLIITDNYKTVRNFDFIKKILSIDEKYGFGIFIMNDKIFNLPAECDNFININYKSAEIFQNILNTNIQKFVVDFTTPLDMYEYSQKMANIPIEFNDDENGSLVSKVGFLELYNVGKIEQLNILNRWKDSNPMLSLQSLIGLGKGGEKIYLDLHEKYHGPHGLIAGMTGSGKSEFIATYILSLAVNYHPYEVQFILIDYKGGGLAGIFENKITGLKLPHLVGTITNLDENEIKRSLASIESELKRRQIIFGKVREKLGDSVVDIYKYQQLYRDGVVEEPVSHLFIICDEFAELKIQQPEFLQQLISISRIGRSLGIHLILATQKPSGVVDNQIWSNSRFRVCLRVQEKSDSTEVIKCPDAAYLKNVGRFYLQVGYNEVFLLGQAAWGGGKYVPTEKVKKKIDTTVEFIDNIGYLVKKNDTVIKNPNEVNYGEEIKNIIVHLNQLALDEGIYNKGLWLEKMPSYININDLKRKYNFIKNEFELNIPIGEYDIPNRQKQELLMLPFYKDGNVLVYGTGGSGKENFITTMIYSSITSYSPLEVIHYILDFGTQALKVFEEIPHVGDVIVQDDVEKINNLFKMLFYMIEERKSLFENYNGDYSIYCKKSGNPIPSVVVTINNYDSFMELFPMFDESLIQLTREGLRYGIYFVLTISNPNNIRSKLRQNFKCEFVLQQNSDSDYSNILGNVNKTYPSKIFGRGIIKLDEVYEFQTAMVAERDEIYNYIEQVKPILINNNDIKAIEVPVLPKIVTKANIEMNLVRDGNFVIGIEKDSLECVKYDLKNSYTNLFLTYDINLYEKFLNPLLEQIDYINNFSTTIINCEKLNINKLNFDYYDQGFDIIFNNICSMIEKFNRMYSDSNYDKRIFVNEVNKLFVIIGIDSFIRKLSTENRNKFSSMIEKGKDLEFISFVFVESIEKIKKYEYESWYKTVVNNTRGIFLGNGLTDQMSLKITKNDRSLRDEISDNFCYVINHGRPRLVKYVEIFYEENK